MYAFFIIEIDNNERGVIGDFTTISDIRIRKAPPSRSYPYDNHNRYFVNTHMTRVLLQVFFLRSSIVSDKIELMMLCRVLQSIFLCLSQSESRTQPCRVRINNYSGI